MSCRRRDSLSAAARALCRRCAPLCAALALVQLLLAPALPSAAEPPACATAFELLSPLPTPHDLEAALFVAPATEDTATTLVVAGRQGALLVSHDGGDTFAAATLPEVARDAHWLALEQPAPDTLVAVAEGLALRSDDRGATWLPVELPRGVHGPVAWADADTALVAPARSHAARSRDAGQSWETFALDELLHLDEAAVALDERTAFGVGRGGLARTADGGRTWQPVALSDEATSIWLHDLAFLPDALTGYAAGDGVLYQTLDGGRTWRPRSLDERAPLVALALPDASTVFALTRNGALWRSFDAGESFDLVELPEGDLSDVAFADRDHGVVTGATGTLLATDDGGATWRSLRRGTGRGLRAVASLGDRIVAVGAGGTRLASEDGRSFEDLAATDALPALYDLASDGTHLLAVAQGALVYDTTLVRDGAAASGDVFGRVAARAPGEFFLALDGGLYRASSAEGAAPEAVALPDPDARVALLAAWQGTLFVATHEGLSSSTDGVAFVRFGPSGLRVRALAPLGAARVIARLEGGVVAEITPERATLVGLEPGFPVLAAHLAPDGTAWAGAGYGLVLRIEPDGEIVLQPLPEASADAVVALAFSDANQGVALTSSGQLYATSDRGAHWAKAAGEWPGQAGAALGERDPQVEGVGTILLLEQQALVAGARGQARRLDLATGAVTELDTPVSADLGAGLRVGARLYLAGTGRTVLFSDDVGASWSFLTDDLAPERVVGLFFDGSGLGTLATEAGTLLGFGDDPESLLYAPLGREPGPLVALRATDDRRLWLVNGTGELLVSGDRGENWELVEGLAQAWQDPGLAVSDFDVREQTLLVVGPGRVQLGALDAPEQAPQSAPRLPALSGLYGHDGHDELLAVAQTGEALRLDAEARVCLAGQVPGGVRDALPWGEGWIVVGDGGLIGRLE